MNTREKKLRGDLWLKLMLFLDHIGLEGRLIEHNALSFNSQGWPQVTLGRVPNTNGLGQSANRSKSPLKRSFNREEVGELHRVLGPISLCATCHAPHTQQNTLFFLLHLFLDRESENGAHSIKSHKEYTNVQYH